MKRICLIAILVSCIGLNCHGESELMACIANDDTEGAIAYFESLESVTYEEMLRVIEDLCFEMEQVYGVECDTEFYTNQFRQLLSPFHEQYMCMGALWSSGIDKRIPNLPEDEWLLNFNLLVGGGEVIVGVVMLFFGSGKVGGMITTDGVRRFKDGLDEVFEERARQGRDSMRYAYI